MAMGFQITFDCADAGKLATFWADVLHYQPAGPPAGFASWEEWLERMGMPPEEWNDGAAISDPEGRSPQLCFLRVPEGKITKNRIHFDLDVSSGQAAPVELRKTEVEAEIQRIEALGGRVVDRYEEPNHYHALMRDPEGNEFCVR